MSIPKSIAALAFLLAAAPVEAQRSGPQRGTAPGSQGSGSNVLLVLVDDVGIEQLNSYGVGSTVAFTPTIDNLVATGVRFDRTWSTPYCSPTRSLLMTGRYGYRTGIGSVIGPGDDPLPIAETTLPELVNAATGGGYQLGAFGKWHLGEYITSFATTGDLLSPNVHGWTHFVGTMQNVQNHYYYAKTENGVAREYFGYSSTDIVDEFLLWEDEISGPWLAMLAFNAAHVPFTAPPPHLHNYDLEGKTPLSHPNDFFRAMIEALDVELGRALAGLGDELANTNVIFVSDNGTTPLGVVPPFNPDQSKGTVYQGGVHVPLIISGPAVSAGGSECDALVHVADIYSTIAELCGVDLEQSYPPGVELDSISLLPYLSSPYQPSLRDVLYTERFSPNAPEVIEQYDRAIRNVQYKLVVLEEFTPVYQRTEELYDLYWDPLELNNLLAGKLQPQAFLAYRDLLGELLGFAPAESNSPLFTTN